MDQYRLVFPVLPGYIVFYLVFNPIYSVLYPQEYIAAIEAGTDMDMFDMISAEQASSTFDYTLATMYNGEYFLIHLTDATVVVETAGTTITINGMYKK